MHYFCDSLMKFAFLSAILHEFSLFFFHSRLKKFAFFSRFFGEFFIFPWFFDKNIFFSLIFLWNFHYNYILWQNSRFFFSYLLAKVSIFFMWTINKTNIFWWLLGKICGFLQWSFFMSKFLVWWPNFFIVFITECLKFLLKS